MSGDRIDAYFVCAGKYHDIDFARLEILKLLFRDPRIRTHVVEDYSDIDGIRAADFLITYTCDVIPTEDQQKALQEWLQGGGRWFALHGTNSILRFLEDGRASCPREAPLFMDMLGSQFVAHPPLQDFKVEITDPDHDLTRDIEPFVTNDEIYICEWYGENNVLLHTEWSGVARGFEEHEWPSAQKHPVLYERHYGDGKVLYFNLGHCRSKYDLQPLIEEYPVIERCSWENPIFYELLERGIRWAHDRGPGEEKPVYGANGA